jgi:hypothetical protein
VNIFSVIARPSIISAWRIGIIPLAMSIVISAIILVWIIRFIIRIGNPNRGTVKPMTIVNANGASAEDNQEPYNQEKFSHLFPLSCKGY